MTQEYKWREILEARMEDRAGEANGKKHVGYKTEKKQIQKKSLSVAPVKERKTCS